MHKLITHNKYGNLAKRIFWFLSVAFCFNCSTSLCGASNNSTPSSDSTSSNGQPAKQASSQQSADGTNTQLDKLENKLFQHDYPKDSTDDRLARLEKMIFGENQKGSTDERVSALVNAVPNLDNSQSNLDNTASAASEPAAETSSANKDADLSTTKQKSKAQDIAADSDAKIGADAGNYPAVTAMETKLLHKDYANEPIKDRLARLEKKVLGQVSTSSDLSERVDQLKAATGIDLARKPGSITDWLEDDDDMTAHSPSISGRGSSDQDFGSPDIYKDMQRSYAAPSNTMRNPFSSAYIPEESSKSPGISINSFGLSQQVTALEHEIFAKSYEHDPLPARLNRLETTVFPGQKPNVDKPLPQRVKNLLAKVPISQQELQLLAQMYQIDTGNNSLDVDNLDNKNSQQISKSHGGLSKIIGSLGSIFSGGMTGGYPTTGGNYMLDPSTGMLVDPRTGTVINPNTGTVYSGNHIAPYGGYNNYYNNGMSPFGMGSGFGFGSGGFGSGFGFGFR